MEVKNNVRQRRQDRIRTLQLHHKDELPDDEYVPDDDPVYEENRYERLPAGQPPSAPRTKHAAPARIEMAERDPRLEDPEYVWKLREKELLAEFGYGEREGVYAPEGRSVAPDVFGSHADGGFSGPYADAYGGRHRVPGGYGREGAYAPPSHTSEPWRFVPTKRSIALKLILSGILFGGVWGMFQLPHPWAQTGQKWVRYALTEDMEFAKVTAWYKETFSGAPSFLPTFRASKEQESQKVVAKTTDGFVRPARGKLLEPFSTAHPWVVVQTADGAVVRALDTGRVVYAGTREASGFTIVVQHASGYQSTYGLLQPSGLQQGDWLEAGESVGKVSQEPGQAFGRLYFSLTKELHAIDPADVVTFD